MKTTIKAAVVLAVCAALFTGGNSLASMMSRAPESTNAAQEMVGNMSRADFDRINAQGNAAVAAITPTSGGTLSKADQKLMMQVAMGGMMQFEVSRVAVQKATSSEARILAQSEVEEQTAVSAKLQEIASAKGMTLPTAPDSKTRSMVSKMQGMTAGADFDRTYVRESGVNGHVKLQQTMSKVQANAADPSMKALASATMPVIQTHLNVSRSVVAKMSGNGNNRSSAGR